MPDIPHFCVGDDLHPMHGVKHSAQVLIELVKLVELLVAPGVPEDAVREDQIIRGIEGGFVSEIHVAVKLSSCHSCYNT